jgi:hypothetical protein
MVRRTSLIGPTPATVEVSTASRPAAASAAGGGTGGARRLYHRAAQSAPGYHRAATHSSAPVPQPTSSSRPGSGIAAWMRPSTARWTLWYSTGCRALSS